MAGLNVLRRDKAHSVLGGVCSGLAAYFDIDKNNIRIAVVLLAIFGGTGVLAYIVAWIVIPEARTAAEIEYMDKHNR